MTPPRWILGLSATAWGTGVVLIGPESGSRVIDLAVGLTFTWLGLFMWRPRGRLPAGLMTAIGITWLVGGLATALLVVHRGPLVHLLAGYPSGRPRSRLTMAVVVAGYLNALVYPLGHSEWATAVLCAAVLGVVAVDHVRSTVLERRARAVGLAGTVAVTLVLGLGSVAQVADVGADDAVLWVYEIVLLGVAMSVFIDHRWGPWRHATIAGLVVDLGELEHGGAQRAKLALALGDPSVLLAYWVPEAGGYVDVSGRPVEPVASVNQVLTVLEHDGDRLGALVHDEAVVEDDALVRDIVSLARIALVNARLQARLHAGVVEVEASRRRIVVAADEERRRLEQELRDSAERRLLVVEDLLATSGDRCAGLRELLAELLADLRAFAHGVHPGTLTESGLRAALTALVGVAPLRVEVDVPVGRLPGPVEAAIYFVCCEGLANVAKHADAAVVRISVRAGDDTVIVEVTDDGVGGADPSLGSGLQGLADRVTALGGTFHLDSSRGTGTRLSCVLPD